MIEQPVRCFGFLRIVSRPHCIPKTKKILWRKGVGM